MDEAGAPLLFEVELLDCEDCGDWLDVCELLPYCEDCPAPLLDWPALLDWVEYDELFVPGEERAAEPLY